jgi:REP element-mobilizing transposase RayT
VSDYRIFYRRRLPHWQPAGATFFVTFRLAHSLPRSVVEKLIAERDHRERSLSRIADAQERRHQAYMDARRAFGRWDRALDSASQGPHWLKQPAVADIVAEALYHRDQRVYDLWAYCIMPNHVHLVCTPLAREDGTYWSLLRILQSLKGYTGHRANEILGRSGTFWQRESYDHVVRDEDELTRIVDYVKNNPPSAQLVSRWEDWPWTYIK